MKFGALPEQQLATVDFRLPPEPTFNNRILTGRRIANPKAYVGAATWGGASWVGKLYPGKTPATTFRQLYVQHFNAIELNATHYNIYKPAIIEEWAAPARGKDFKFCPKFPQQISHYSHFKNTDVLTDAFLNSIYTFGENLGPVFLQLSEHFAPSQKDILFSYLASLPSDVTFFLEVRHPGWMATEKESEILFETLKALHMGIVITDTPGRRDLVHMHLTVPKLFLRFVCNALHPTTYNRTNAWIQRLHYWYNTGLEDAYIFLHPGSEAAIPELAAFWVQELNTQCQLQLKPPASVQQQLF